jgi:hypothetical protein
MKRFVLLLVITCLLVGSGYLYIGYSVTDPFSIDFSAMTSENLPTAMIGSKQINSFRLVNTSNKSIELLDIKLDGYDGIEISPIITTGRTTKNLIVPSHRIENTNGWSTNEFGAVRLHITEGLRHRGRTLK